LTLAAMRRKHARIHSQPLPQTPFDRTLANIERAVDIGPFSPALLHTAWSVLQGSDEDFEPTTTTIN
jgi:hypothetical protein